jgi:hypothetical protein
LEKFVNLRILMEILQEKKYIQVSIWISIQSSKQSNIWAKEKNSEWNKIRIWSLHAKKIKRRKISLRAKENIRKWNDKARKLIRV